MAKTTYSSINAAAKGLLGEACSIANECGKDYAVCGGWSPYLRNSFRVPHPGTRDVDLLFSGGAAPESLKDVVNAFLERGYFLSAKHEFQVLRSLPVGGKEFVFNVDFLHPHEGEIKGDMFVDQVEFPIPHEDFKSTYVFAKSIALPNAGFVFNGFIESDDIEFVLPSGSEERHRVPLIDEVGVIATKSKSCLIQKRTRDIFDIYLAVTSPKNPALFKANLARLESCHNGIFASLECIGEGLTKRENKFGIPSVFADQGVDFGEAAISLRAFLKELGFDSESDQNLNS